MARMSVRLWLAGGLAACAVAALLGWTFIVAPQREKVALNWAELSASETQTASLRARNAVLDRQYSEIEAARAALDIKRLSLPTLNGLDSLVRSLDDIAATTGVTVEEVTALEPVDMSTLTAAGTTSLPATESTEAAATGTESDAAATGTTSAVSASRVVYVLPVTVRASGSLTALQAFLAGVQAAQARAILVTAVTLVPNASATTLGDDVMLTLETGVFVSPDAAPATTTAPAG